MTLSITLWYSRNRWRSMSSEAMAFNTDSPSLHLSFLDSTCVLYVSILSKLILRYLRLFMRSMSFPLKETAGIACPTALLLRVQYRACALLGIISDSVSWHQCDICLLAPMWHLFQLLLDSGDCCVDVTGCFVDKPVVCQRKHSA